MDSGKRIGPTYLSTWLGLYYTVPVGGQFSLRSIRFANTSALAATVTLLIGGAGPGREALKNAPLPPYSVYSELTLIQLEAGEEIWAQADTDVVVVMILSGVLTT